MSKEKLLSVELYERPVKVKPQNEKDQCRIKWEPAREFSASELNTAERLLGDAKERIDGLLRHRGLSWSGEITGELWLDGTHNDSVIHGVWAILEDITLPG